MSGGVRGFGVGSVDFSCGVVIRMSVSSIVFNICGVGNKVTNINDNFIRYKKR